MPSDATTPAPRALVSPSSGDSVGRRSLAGRLSQVSRFVQGSLATSTQADEGAAHTVAARPDAADNKATLASLRLASAGQGAQAYVCGVAAPRPLRRLWAHVVASHGLPESWTSRGMVPERLPTLSACATNLGVVLLPM